MKIAAIITSCKRFCAVKQATVVSIAAFVHIAKGGTNSKQPLRKGFLLSQRAKEYIKILLFSSYVFWVQLLQSSYPKAF